MTATRDTIPVAQTISLCGFDPVEMSEVLQGGMLDHVQLADGLFDGDLLQVTTPDLKFDFGRYNLPLFAEGAFTRDAVTLAFVFHGREHIQLNGQRVEPASLLRFSEGCELKVSLPHDCQWAAFQVSADELAALGWKTPQKSLVQLMIEPAALRLTHRAVLHARRDLTNISLFDQSHILQVMAELQDALAQIISDAMARDTSGQPFFGGRARERAYRLARRASDFIAANLSSPISIAELCAGQQCTYKELERAFRLSFDLTPKSYLKLKRLSQLRAQLTRSDVAEKITDTYLSCGLTHFSRSAQDYAQLFGELPSATAASNRRI